MSASVSPENFGRDEDVWFGRRDEDAEVAASKSLAATAARIVGAKPFPVAAKRLEELTRTPSARIEQVVSVLESDPALSARLLRLVNSAGYGLKARCTSVRHAAVLVGTRRLNQVATTAAILDLFESSNGLAAELLEHASIVGSLCRYLAVHLGLPHDELFTCGFLHDIGKIMLLDTEREIYPSVLQQFGGQFDTIHEQERRIFGFDHAVLGAHVLTAWNIPEPVPKVIAWHHQPARALQDSLLSAMVQTLRLADMLAYDLGRHEDAAGVQLVAASDAARYLDISEPQLAAMWGDLGALRERSRARSHGEADLEVAEPRFDVPTSLRPRGSISPRSMRTSSRPTYGSLVPTDSDPPGSVRPEQASQDLPKRLSCVVCGTGGFGNICQACGGNVCPSHQVGTDEWCSLCEDEFVDFKSSYRLPPSALTGAGSVVILSLIGSLASAWSAGNTGVSALAAPLLMGVVWVLVLPIAVRLWVKLRFMKGLTRRTPPQAAAPSGGTDIKDEGEQRPLEDEAEELRLVPSVLPDYDRTTLQVSVPPLVEPFAAGLAGMLPPPERRMTTEPPPSSRGPMVIRVDVPSLEPAAMGGMSRATLPGGIAAPPISVIPPREFGGALAAPIANEGPPLAAVASYPAPPEPPAREAPSSAPPPSDGPEIYASELSLPHHTLPSIPESHASVAPATEAAPAPVSVTLAPPQADDPVPQSDEPSGVRHVLLRNAPGVLSEVCTPVVLNRCS